MEFSSEIIDLRSSVEDLFISASIEQTIILLEKLSGPFDFRGGEETMVRA